MSVPARKVGAVKLARRAGLPASVRRFAQGTQPRFRPAPAPHRGPVARPRRRKHHLGFLILSSVVMGSMILGLVSLNALLAQRSFRIDDLRGRIDVLTQERLELQHEQAALSAPGRIAEWAHRHGMRLPDDIRSLHVPSKGTTAAPAGAAGLALASLRQALEAVA